MVCKRLLHEFSQRLFEARLCPRMVNFGIFARKRSDQARQEAKLFFQNSAEKRELLKYTMENTDSVWRRRLRDAGQNDELL